MQVQSSQFTVPVQNSSFIICEASSPGGVRAPDTHHSDAYEIDPP